MSFAINPCFLSPCLPARFCELSNESNTQVDNELNTQVDKRIKHLSRHPFHANSWMACIAPHGQNQRVPAKLIDDMYLIAQERRVYKAREMDYGEREAKETLPINMCWKTPDSSLPSKLVSHDKGEGMCGNEHIRVFRHFPNEPCVLACMMLKGLRLDPSTPMPCEHVWLMLEGFHIMLHVLLHGGLMFHPSKQDVLEECRFKLLIKTCR